MAAAQQKKLIRQLVQRQRKRSLAVKKQKSEQPLLCWMEKRNYRKKNVTFNKGEKLFDVLKNNYAIEDNDGMITSIDGQAQDDKNNKYWVFTINDEQVNSGAKDVVLQEGDRVVFKLEQF